MELRRITTHYDPVEDRIRLTGEDESGRSVALWLTRRLLNRLIPVILRWLERREEALIESDFFRVAAENPADAFIPQDPVREAPSQRRWLVKSVNINRAEEITLLFQGGDEEFSLTLGPRPLRRWLDVLYALYRKAEWPQDGWPEWAEPEKTEMLVQ